MNFQGFKYLIERVAREWLQASKDAFKENFKSIHAYLQTDPFSAAQTEETEKSYEKLMDVRLKLYVRIIGILMRLNSQILLMLFSRT